MSDVATSRARRSVTSSEAAPAGALLGVCASQKPGPGQGTRSAVRSLLTFALEAVGRVYPHVALLDLRRDPLPLFDGRPPSALEDPGVDLALSSLGRAGGLLLGVPAYWSGVSGVFKNFVDVCCGPAYDLPEPRHTVFSHKPTGLVVVGADADSARRGVEDASRILASAGARIVGPAVSVANPRSGDVDPRALAGELIALAGELARRCQAGAPTP